MKQVFRFIFIVILFFSVFGQMSFAQRMLISTEPDASFKRAKDLYEKQKYGAAQKVFTDYIHQKGSESSGYVVDAEYYSAVCAIELYNADASYLVSRFVKSHPESPRSQELFFRLGKYHYNLKNYDEAITCFKKIDRSGLSQEEVAEYWFDMGYSYFSKDSLEKARKCFNEIKDTDNKYSSPATYYYSHISYTQKNYGTALKGFLKLTDDETFAPIVPYYIVQIYYLEQNYDKVIDYAANMLDSVSPGRAAEVSRIVGESYYRKNKFRECIPYFEKYFEEAKNPSKEDCYELGYAYYKNQDYSKAAKEFEPLADLNNLISQNAMYHLADCYIHLHDKNSARMAFSSASKLDFDPKIKEDALFNYALVTYELSYSPFNEAVNALNEYIKQYPNSERTDEAYTYLVQAYLTTKNYKDALEFLDKIKVKDESALKAYQRAAYYRGLELLTNQEYGEAIALFNKSLKYGQFYKDILAKTYFWKGEAYYRLGKYTEAIVNYNDFLTSHDASFIKEYNQSHYSLGYAYYNRKEYTNAMLWFKKFVTLMKSSRDKTVCDAYNRIGDTYFVAKRYWDAMENYEKAIAMKTADVDYAMFQKAFCYGLVDRNEKKIELLSSLMKDYPNSPYIDNALYEMGKSYIALKNRKMAIEYYNRLLSDYPSSSYVKKALLQLGLEYYNDDNNDKALESYKRLVKEFPATDESRYALTGIKNIYVDMNQIGEYVNFMKSLGNEQNVSTAEQDSLTFTAAENLYMAGDCSKSLESMNKYIENYPNGNFLVTAHFYKADCDSKQKNYDQALKSYNYIISKPKSDFTEQALMGAAEINFNQKDYAAAFDNYSMLEKQAENKNNVLEALTGEMRCAFLSKNYNQTLASAHKILSTDNVSEELTREAGYKIARTYYDHDSIDSAMIYFRPLSKEVRSAEGAEAKYRVAEILYRKSNFKESEKELFDFISKNTAYQNWIAKGFILLSDIYVQKGDDFQASHTLQSIIDNYDNKTDGILDEAKEKLKKIDDRKMFHQSEGNTDRKNKEQK